MQIYGPYRVSTTQPSSPAQRSGPQKPAEAVGKATAAPTDQLDLSSSVSAANRLTPAESAANGQIRIDRVAEIRRQIADGSYDTPARMDAALDKFLDQYA